MNAQNIAPMFFANQCQTICTSPNYNADVQGPQGLYTAQIQFKVEYLGNKESLNLNAIAIIQEVNTQQLTTVSFDENHIFIGKKKAIGTDVNRINVFRRIIEWENGPCFINLSREKPTVNMQFNKLSENESFFV